MKVIENGTYPTAPYRIVTAPTPSDVIENLRLLEQLKELEEVRALKGE